MNDERNNMTHDDIEMSTLSVAEEVISARFAAHIKHGMNGVEAIPSDSPEWLAILGEEVGEMAEEAAVLALSTAVTGYLGRISHTLTYDADPSKLRAELIDILAVGTAWVAAIDRMNRFQEIVRT